MPDSTESLRNILVALERSLDGLEARGAAYLNLPPDNDLLALLKTASAGFASAATNAESTTPSPATATAPHSESPVAGESDAAPPPERSPREIGTLESLKFQFRNCTACGLSQSRNRLVFGVGDDAPRLMFIGEGPGAEEDQQGLPFVGRAGGLLTGLILALGLTREDVYITNVVKCRPPENRNPEPEEAVSCRPILDRQIELLDPGLIVTLGNVPLKALNPRAKGITRERGNTFLYRDWTVLPTFHPSYLLRNAAGLKDCWSDFKQAMALAYANPDADGA